jgi:hypothetical protein
MVVEAEMVVEAGTVVEVELGREARRNPLHKAQQHAWQIHNNVAMAPF